VFGAAAARATAPPLLMRLIVAFGLGAAAFGATAPHLLFARELIDAGVFAITAAGGALVLVVLFGRAPTMRDQAP